MGDEKEYLSAEDVVRRNCEKSSANAPAAWALLVLNVEYRIFGAKTITPRSLFGCFRLC